MPSRRAIHQLPLLRQRPLTKLIALGGTRQGQTEDNGRGHALCSSLRSPASLSPPTSCPDLGTIFSVSSPPPGFTLLCSEASSLLQNLHQLLGPSRMGSIPWSGFQRTPPPRHREARSIEQLPCPQFPFAQTVRSLHLEASLASSKDQVLPRLRSTPEMLPPHQAFPTGVAPAPASTQTGGRSRTPFVPPSSPI